MQPQTAFKTDASSNDLRPGAQAWQAHITKSGVDFTMQMSDRMTADSRA